MNTVKVILIVKYTCYTLYTAFKLLTLIVIKIIPNFFILGNLSILKINLYVFTILPSYVKFESDELSFSYVIKAINVVTTIYVAPQK